MNETKFNLSDKIILGFAISLIITNFLLLFFSPRIMNSLSIFLFQLLTMLFGVYIAFRITTISVMNKTIALQKNTAKTAIRHIRGYQWNIVALIELIKKKISHSNDNKLKNILTEIDHHLVNLNMGISLSENDFKDILGEEFKEEHMLITKLDNDIELLNKKVNEVKKLSKKKEKLDKERIKALNEEIRELRKDISINIDDFPIIKPVQLPGRFHSNLGIELQSMATPLANISATLSAKLKPITTFSLKSEEQNYLSQKENQSKHIEKTVETKKRKPKKE